MQDLPDAVTVFLEIGEQSIDAGMFRDLYGCERYVEMLHIINEAWKGNVDSNPAFEEPSMILLEQIFTIDKSRIERFMGYATPGNVWSASAIRPFRNAVVVAVIRSFALDCILRSSLVSSSLLNGGSVSQKVSA